MLTANGHASNPAGTDASADAPCEKACNGVEMIIDVTGGVCRIGRKGDLTARLVLRTGPQIAPVSRQRVVGPNQKHEANLRFFLRHRPRIFNAPRGRGTIEHIPPVFERVVCPTVLSCVSSSAVLSIERQVHSPGPPHLSTAIQQTRGRRS